MEAMRPRLLALALTPAAALSLLLAGAGTAQAAPTPAPTAAPAVPLPAAAPAPAPPDPATVAAQAQVDALGADVARTTAELTAGTARLEQGQAQLAARQVAAAQARAAADAALAAATAARARLALVVNATYRAPRPDELTLALAAVPGRVSEVVLADAQLDHVRGNQQELLGAATRASATAQGLVAEADRQAGAAQAEQGDLAGQVAALQAQALAARTRLDAAAEQLRQARAAQEAAAAAAAGAALLAGAPDPGGALCTAASTAGYANGFLPPEVLCPIAGGGRLRADAAAAFNALAAAHPICVTDSYRSYSAQVDVYAAKPTLAAVPGTSNHGLGLAVDLCGGIEDAGSAEHAWMQANAPRYGWVHPAWAEPGGSRPEPWHWEYAGAPSTTPTS